MTDSIQIYINSKYYNYTANGGLYFILPLIETATQCHIHLSVANAVIPISYYNINNSNNIIQYGITGNSTVYTVTIPVGNYNVLQLRDYLNTAMPNIVVAYNTLTNKYTFTHSTTDFTIFSTSTSQVLLGLNIYDKTSISKVLVSDNCIDMSPIKSLLIKTRLQTGNMNRMYPQSTNILCAIPVNAGKFENLQYDNKSNYKSNLYMNVLNEIMIKITDQDNNVIDFNGCNWFITLQIDVNNYVTSED